MRPTRASDIWTKPQSLTVANSVPVLDRLVGLETEYAIRFRPTEGQADPPTRYQLYQALIARLKRHVPTAPARHFKEGLFLANGGAVWFEGERPAAGSGLIEGSTPECRGPLEAVRYQRAMDQLLSHCARMAEVDGLMSLVKNDRDGRGHVYGAQENYEATLGSAGLLWVWRAGLVLLAPLLLLAWAGVALMIVACLAYLAVAGLCYLPLRWLTRPSHRLAVVLFGRDLAEGRETGMPTPVWMETVSLAVTRVVYAPLAICLSALIWLTAFRRTRRQLVPFLVSRCVVAGAGLLDAEGHFHLADKAPAINCLLGLGGFWRDRPVFTCGHFFKALCVDTWFAPSDLRHLWRARQRLQVGLGDSNMCETAEFLRIGTTALMLDVIEAGELPPMAPLAQPIAALHAFCADLSLTQRARLADGREVTAVELQRFYWEACQQYVARHPDAPEEAYEVMDAWDEVLSALERHQSSGEMPTELVGIVDWVTKWQLLDEAGRDASWEARKKIDIRYHELSPLGYFQMLQAAGLAAVLHQPQELERAVRTPPADTPATMRGHYIREFSSDSEPLSATWHRIVIGRGWGSRSVRLVRYERAAAARSHRRRQGSRDAGQR